MKIEVYTDGSAQTADKPGGWASVIVIDGKVHKELSGYLEKATNNDAELIAALKGLDHVLNYLAAHSGSFPLEHEVTLISDSQIVLNWANGTYRFKQADKIDLYDALCRLVRKLKIKTQWVRGHSGDIWNERCDHLANKARKSMGLEEVLDKPAIVVDTKIGSKKTGVAGFYYQGKLMLVDFEQMIVEPYNRDIHGKRGSMLEIREGK